MPDYFKPVRAGDKLEIKAPTWNAMLEAALAHKRAGESGGVPGAGRVPVPDVVMIHNASGQDVPAFGILGIDGVLVGPDTDLQQFLNKPCLSGVSPTADHAGKFAVTINAIASGGIGRAIVLGVTACKVEMKAASDKYADVLPGSTTKLKSAATGAAKIIYTAGSTGEQWALVQIGSSGASDLARVRVYSNATGGGIYIGNVVKKPAGAISINSTITEAMLGVHAEECIILNAAEVGQVTHDLTEGTPKQKTFLAMLIGQSDETPARPVYQINGFDYGDCQ